MNNVPQRRGGYHYFACDVLLSPEYRYDAKPGYAQSTIGHKLDAKK
jgi:hypothetical protein